MIPVPRRREAPAADGGSEMGSRDEGEDPHHEGVAETSRPQQPLPGWPAPRRCRGRMGEDDHDLAAGREDQEPEGEDDQEGTRAGLAHRFPGHRWAVTSLGEHVHGLSAEGAGTRGPGRSLDPGSPAEVAVCGGKGRRLRWSGRAGQPGGRVRTRSCPVNDQPPRAATDGIRLTSNRPAVTSTSSSVPMLLKVPEKVPCSRAVSPLKEKVDTSSVPSVSQKGGVDDVVHIGSATGSRPRPAPRLPGRRGWQER